MIKIVMTLDICAFLYSMLLLVVYFSKKRVKSFETSIFGNLIFVAIASIVFEFFQLLLAMINFEKYLLLIYIIAFLYVLSYFIMILFTSSYIFLKVYMCKEKDDKKIHKLKNKLIIGSLVISIIMLIVSMFFSPLETIQFDGDAYYGTGMSVIFMVLCYIVLGASTLYALIFNRKNNNNKDVIFYISITLFLIINAVFRMLLPGLMVNNMVNVFIVAIMFFTIENPDLKLITELQAANNAKDDFLSSMSHEMKTPLNAILGLSSVGDGEDWRDVNRQSNILLDIVNNVIDSNSFDQNRIRDFKETFNIKLAVSSTIEETKNSIIGKPILFSTNVIDKDIYANSEAIVSICDRLLSNAYKFTEKGFIAFTVDIVDNKLNICIKDSGVGINRETLDKIFDRFNRNKTDMDGTTPGLGLGLSLVKATVDALNGIIEIKSEIGTGTEVYVVIPLEGGNL